MRRWAGLVLAAAVASVMSVPGPAAADTVCGRVVCANTDAGALFECAVVRNQMGGQTGECLAHTVGVAGGSSPLMIPGSAEWSISAECNWSFPSGLFGCGYNDRDPQVCTWAGLGENECGGSLHETFGPIHVHLPPGECIGQRLRATDSDVVVSVLASSVASKGLLLLGPIDQASSSELVTINLSDIPDGDDTCAKP